jgi:hypothetical protein
VTDREKREMDEGRRRLARMRAAGLAPVRATRRYVDGQRECSPLGLRDFDKPNMQPSIYPPVVPEFIQLRRTEVYAE